MVPCFSIRGGWAGLISMNVKLSAEDINFLEVVALHLLAVVLFEQRAL